MGNFARSGQIIRGLEVKSVKSGGKNDFNRRLTIIKQHVAMEEDLEKRRRQPNTPLVLLLLMVMVIVLRGFERYLDSEL